MEANDFVGFAKAATKKFNEDLKAEVQKLCEKDRELQKACWAKLKPVQITYQGQADPAQPGRHIKDPKKWVVGHGERRSHIQVDFNILVAGVSKTRRQFANNVQQPSRGVSYTEELADCRRQLEAEVARVRAERTRQGNPEEAAPAEEYEAFLTKAVRTYVRTYIRTYVAVCTCVFKYLGKYIRIYVQSYATMN